MMEDYKRLNRELKYSGVIVDFYEDTMQLPNGNMAKWDLISHKGATAIVAVKDDGKLFMVRQFRNPLDRMTLELPAGALNSREEEPEACALRELEEETGYKAGKIEHLVDMFTTVAFCDEKIYMYVATDLIPSKQNLDDDEFLNVEKIPFDTLFTMVMSGEITDAKTVIATLKLKEILSKEEI